jgi:hypothetical protein
MKLKKNTWRMLGLLFGIVALLILALAVASPRSFKLAGAALNMVTLTCEDITQIPKTECEALSALYNATGGANWSKSYDWFQAANPCTWYGVTCDEEQEHVAGLYLQVNMLTGSLPSEISNLTHLKDLSVQRNQLSGNIPIELANLSKLETLNLAQNQLSGPVPAGLGDLDGLKVLNLGYNQFDGTIPPHVGDMTNLLGLYLNNNLLTGSIPPELGNLTKLRELYLSNNQLAGEIPAEIGEMAELVTLHLEANQLSGHLPSQLGNLSNLKKCFLQENLLTGIFPPELANLENLTAIDLHNNALIGDLPSALTNLAYLGEGPADIVDLNFNSLYASDASTADFLTSKDPNWMTTQTLPPADMQTANGPNGVTLTWTPILYSQDAGYYEISFATNSSGPFTVHGQTADKTIHSYLVNGLTADTEYYFRVRTYTPAHDSQANELWSHYSQIASMTYLPSSVELSSKIFLPLITR